MPRKFQPVRIDNEDPKELTIRRRGAVERFKCEAALLSARGERHAKNFQRIDEQMKSSLEENYPNKIAKYLIRRWDEDCKREEQKSKELYAKNINWLLKNLTSELRKSSYSKENRTNDAHKSSKEDDVLEDAQYLNRNQLKENFQKSMLEENNKNNIRDKEMSTAGKKKKRDRWKMSRTIIRKVQSPSLNI